MLEFKKVSDAKKEKENKSFSISQGNSPFVNGVTFEVNGFGYKEAKTNDGKTTSPSPILETTIGDLFLTMIMRSKVNSDGEILEPDGTFNKFVKDTIAKNSNKNNGEILSAIVDECKNKKIKVNREYYSAKSSWGGIVAASIVKLNFE